MIKEDIIELLDSLSDVLGEMDEEIPLFIQVKLDLIEEKLDEVLNLLEEIE